MQIEQTEIGICSSHFYIVHSIVRIRNFPWDVLVAFLKESWVERSSCKSRLFVVLRFLRLSAEVYKDNEVKERVFRGLKD